MKMNKIRIAKATVNGKTDVEDTVQLYLKYNGMTILLAQKEC